MHGKCSSLLNLYTYATFCNIPCVTGENREQLLHARVEPLDAELAAPRPLGRLLDRRDEAVHVIAAVAVVAEEQLFSEIQMLWSMLVGDKVLKLPICAINDCWAKEQTEDESSTASF